MKKEIQTIPKRDLGPLFRWLRDRMFGRETKHCLRFAQDISDRTQPDAKLPDGPSHKLFANYYYLRDARRMVTGPVVITDPGGLKSFPLQESQGKQLTTSVVGVAPGQLYDPPIEPTMPIRDPAKLEKLKEQEQ